jgi:outer membrane protein OmpA-like peptidoglycan-associated protein
MTKTTKTIIVVGTILVLSRCRCIFLFSEKTRTNSANTNTELSIVLQDAFDNLNFDFGKSTIRQSSFPALDKLAQTLVEAKNWKLEIDGHTDDKGSNSYNTKTFARPCKCR